MTEERLRQAAVQAGQAITNSLPPLEKCPHTFSPLFLWRMKPLLRRARHPYHLPALRAACMLLVCLLGCGIFLQVNVEAREIFLGWVSRLEDGTQHYFFSGKTILEDNTEQYMLSKIPEGYQEFFSELKDHDGYVDYCNDAGQILEFGYLKQDTESTTSHIAFITEDDRKHPASVNGTPADVYIDESGNTANLIVWTDEAKETLFYVNGFFDEEQLIQLAESVQIKS